MAIRTGRLGEADQLSGTSRPDYLFGGLNRGIYYRSLTEDDVEEILADHEDEFLEAGYTEEQWKAFQERTLHISQNDWTEASAVQPAAPPDGDGWRQVRGGQLETFHPGADQDFRRIVGEVQLGDTGQTARYGQQATYDDGRLITHGPGAGTPDLQAPGRFGGNIFSHDAWDIVPFNVLGWQLYHQLGWSPHREWSPEAAAEFWGQDGDDILRGGAGNDTYGFITGGQRDIIRDDGKINEADILQVYGGGDLNNVEDIRFSLSGGGEDLRVVLPGGDRVTIEDMNDPAKQIEILTLFEGNKEVGGISLVDKYGELVLKKAPPPEPKPEQSEPETVQDLGGERPSEKKAEAPEPEPGPRPEPPAPETVQDLGGDKPSGEDPGGDEKIDFAGLPPPPPPLPPGPPPSLLGSEPEPGPEPEPPVSDTVQDLGGNEPTGSNDEIFIA